MCASLRRYATALPEWRSSGSDRALLGNGWDEPLQFSQHQPNLMGAAVIDERNGAGIDRSAV